MDYTENEAMSMSPETYIYQYTRITNFPQFSKAYFCNTCQPTIFIKFVIRKWPDVAPFLISRKYKNFYFQKYPTVFEIFINIVI